MTRPNGEIFIAAAVIGATLLLLLFPMVAKGDGVVIPAPYLRSVEPQNAKPGDVAHTTGEWLGKAHVAELFLTDGKQDFRVEILKQTDKQIEFRVAGGTPPARYRLMLMTFGAEAKLLEQPVFLTVTKIADVPTTIPTATAAAGR